MVIGAALLYGDGAITPAISVLSARSRVCGRASGAGSRWSSRSPAPSSLGLFAIQKRGTGTIGKLFGPVMLVWFGTIGALGAWQIIAAPVGAARARRRYAACATSRRTACAACLILGRVVLAVTGGEALYADMGHFGAPPDPLACGSASCMPALVLCYFGQGALHLARSERRRREPVLRSGARRAPATFALVVLSSAATVIASQALISGAFSLTRQAMQLGYFPRVTIKHTAHHTEGQIYIPEINWLLAMGCILARAHRSAPRIALAAAYGIAVTGTMGITSIVYYVVARQTWGWSRARALPLLALFLAFDMPFFVANLFKFLDGG